MKKATLPVIAIALLLFTLSPLASALSVSLSGQTSIGANSSSSLLSTGNAASGPNLLGGVVTCQDAYASTDENTAVAVNVLSDCQYLIGGVKQVLPLHVVSVSQPAHGSAVINPNNEVTYTPSSGYSGNDSFQFTAADPTGLLTGSATAHIAIISTTSSLQVLTQDTSGNALTGFYTELDLNGAAVNSGYTPMVYTLNNGVTYSVMVDGYGSCTFSHWAGSGSTADPMSISINSNTSITAVLNCGPTIDPTSTAVVPSQASVMTGQKTDYTATVTDTASSPTAPTGTVTWSDGGAGGSFSAGTCTLGSPSGASSSCQVSYTAPSAAASVTVTASYSGDSGHSSSSGSASLTVQQSQSYAISQSSSGLVFQDPLTATMTQQQLDSQGTYTWQGSAQGYPNAPYNYSEDSQGLHIGVQAPAPGAYAGFFGTKNFNTGDVFHAVITAPSRTIPSDDYNVGIYVQTGNGPIDYIFCGPDTSSSGTFWGVTIATSNNNNSATNYNNVYVDTSANQPLTRSCTVVTDGNNLLKVYIDNSLVYSTTSANLGYSRPLEMYLEVESSYNGQELYGTFTDFYVTTSTTLTVNGVPSGVSSVQLVSSSGTVLATSAVTNGVATFDLGPYTYPVSASIVLKDSSGGTVASSGTFNLYGGDVYTVS